MLLLQVRIWDVKTQTCLVTLSGHSGAVTALRFSRDGGLLASGSADTTLVVWDVVAEAGLCRFKGHKDAVTDVVSMTGTHGCTLPQHSTACLGWGRCQRAYSSSHKCGEYHKAPWVGRGLSTAQHSAAYLAWVRCRLRLWQLH